MLVARKVLLMMSFLFFSSKVEQAWFFGSMVIITAMVMHSFARPFEDDLIDICEFLSLISLLFIQQSALVFKVIDDPVNPDVSNSGRILSSALKYMSLVLIVANCILAMMVEVRVWQHVQDSDEDYKVKMTRQKMEALQAELESLESVLERAEADAEAYARRKARLERLKLHSIGSAGHLSSMSDLASLPSDEPRSEDGVTDQSVDNFIRNLGGGLRPSDEPRSAGRTQDREPSPSFENDEGDDTPTKKKRKPTRGKKGEAEAFENPIVAFEAEGASEEEEQENPLSAENASGTEEAAAAAAAAAKGGETE
jgi:hypothetical protein